MNRKNGISVIICCYNSACRLPETLKYLAKQKFSEYLSWEIILVDNASKDNTANIGSSEWATYNLPEVGFRIIEELKPGLSHARHAGIEASNFEYLIFCDDDNWFYPDYIQIMFDIFQCDSKIGAVGGVGIPEWEPGTPEYIKPQAAFFATGKQSNGSGDITNTRQYVYGAGMGVRKSAMEVVKSNGFHSHVPDRIGSKLTSGGDNEICYQLIICKYKIWYSEELTFKHFISLSRTTKEYFFKLIFSMGYSTALILPYLQLLNNKKGFKSTITYEFFSKLYFLIRYILFRKPFYFKYGKKPDFAKRITWTSAIGYLYGLLFFRRKIIKMKKELRKNRYSRIETVY